MTAIVAVMNRRLTRRLQPTGGGAASCTVAVLALGLAWPACNTEGAPTEVSYGTAGSEELAVYGAVLPAFLTIHPGPVVLDPLTSFDYDHDSWARCYDVVQAPPSVSPALWQSLPEANSRPVAIDPIAAAALAPDLIAVEVDQREALNGAGYSGPNEFTESYPDRSLLQVSRVAFSRDEREAIVYVWRTCGMLCGDGAVFALARVGNEWAITFQSGLGAS